MYVIWTKFLVKKLKSFAKGYQEQLISSVLYYLLFKST